MEKITYLLSLVNVNCHSNWCESLREVLQSSDAKDVRSNPQLYRTSFLLSRARMRQDSSIRLGLNTFGLPSLIEELERFPAEQQLESYEVETATHIGSCIVLNGRIIGCEFVNRGIAQTYPFKG